MLPFSNGSLAFGSENNKRDFHNHPAWRNTIGPCSKRRGRNPMDTSSMSPGAIAPAPGCACRRRVGGLDSVLGLVSFILSSLPTLPGRGKACQGGRAETGEH